MQHWVSVFLANLQEAKENYVFLPKAPGFQSSWENINGAGANCDRKDSITRVTYIFLERDDMMLISL